MARTLPFPQLHIKRPTASLVSKKVLTSIIGQILITSSFQLWAFTWIRSQDWYNPPAPPDNTPRGQLNAVNFENSALFLMSCFQYILVAAVFSIGPPFRKAMSSNGWLMLSFSVLTLLNLIILLAPTGNMRIILELVILPFHARMVLLFVVILNVLLSMAFEQWGVQVVVKVLGPIMRLHKDRRRHRDGKAYKLLAA